MDSATLFKGDFVHRRPEEHVFVKLPSQPAGLLVRKSRKSDHRSEYPNTLFQHGSVGPDPDPCSWVCVVEQCRSGIVSVNDDPGVDSLPAPIERLASLDFGDEDLDRIIGWTERAV